MSFYKPLIIGAAVDECRRRNGTGATLIFFLGCLFGAISVWTLALDVSMLPVMMLVLSVLCFIAGAIVSKFPIT